MDSVRSAPAGITGGDSISVFNKGRRQSTGQSLGGGDYLNVRYVHIEGARRIADGCRRLFQLPHLIIVLDNSNVLTTITVVLN